MTIQILCFGALSEESDQEEISIAVDQPVSASKAFQLAFHDQPEVYNRWKDNVLYAKNHCHISSHELIQSGDELAVMPPLAGG